MKKKRPDLTVAAAYDGDIEQALKDDLTTVFDRARDLKAEALHGQ
jgi:hypothetical protein